MIRANHEKQRRLSEARQIFEDLIDFYEDTLRERRLYERDE